MPQCKVSPPSWDCDRWYNLAAMGMTTVTLKVKSLKDSKKVHEGEFLVDSGAHFTVLPERVWKELGLKAEKEQAFSLADGKIVSRKLGSAFIEYAGDRIASPVVLGEKHDTPLLGVLTLEAMGLMLDPFKRTIYKSKLFLA